MEDDKISKKQKRMDRYEKVFNDPKFKPIPKKVHKVELNDNRFNAMFSNKDFYSTSKVDKYGKLKNQKNSKHQMEEYYIKNENKNTKNKSKPEKEKEKKKEKENEEEEEREENEDEENEGEEEESDTSEEFQQFLENMNQQNMEDLKDEEVEENIPMGEETSRIAIQNIDWTNIHALDLFVLLNSFCKGSQKVLKVEIYPSEYGMKEMAKENAQGPDKEIFTSEAIVQEADSKDKKKENNISKSKEKEKDKNEEQEEDNEENEEEEENVDVDSSNEGFDPVELRKYELKKLKYYYAVVYCDSKETANSLYNECDGLEIERTQSFLDMRFIPDDLTKFPYPPKEVCDHLPANKEYTQEFKPNSALQDTKVKLTWDQGDPRRQDLISRAFHKEGFNEEDINELLVSSDEEDSDVVKGLGGDESDESEDKNMEFNLLKKKRKMPKFKDGETIEIKFNKGFEGINPDVIKDEENQKENKSKWEKFKEQKKNIRKEKKREERERKNKIKEKRKGNYKNNKNESDNEDSEKKIEEKADKNELDLLVDDEKGKNKEFKFNSKDERFQTKNNIDFAIDPTNKNYKRMKAKKY